MKLNVPITLNHPQTGTCLHTLTKHLLSGRYPFDLYHPNGDSLDKCPANQGHQPSSLVYMQFMSGDLLETGDALG